MPGLVPGIHVFLFGCQKTWMAGTSPAMTINLSSARLCQECAERAVKASTALKAKAAPAANQIAASPSQ
jgi:hypothetical protein